MQYNVHDVLNKVETYNRRKLKFCENEFMVWFEIVIKFQNEALNLQGFYIVLKFHIYLTMINSLKWYIGENNIFFKKSCKRMDSKFNPWNKNKCFGSW